MDLASARSPARREWIVFARRLARRRTALFGLVVVMMVIVSALAAPWLSAYDPVEQDITNRLRPPGALDAAGRAHVLGTDHLGRDILVRMIFGARPALLVGFAAVAISGVLGMAVGLISGYFGGRIDDVFMRLADIQLAFPFILLAIAVIGVLGPSLPVIIVVIGVSSWVVYARVVRGAVLSLREREFVQAAHALGSRDGRILVRHILPNAFTPWLVVATLHGARDRDRVGAVVPGARRPAADADVGWHARRRPRLSLHRLVAGDVPGPGHPRDRAWDQSAG